MDVRMMVEFGDEILRLASHCANDLVAAGEDGLADF